MHLLMEENAPDSRVVTPSQEWALPPELERYARPQRSMAELDVGLPGGMSTPDTVSPSFYAAEQLASRVVSAAHPDPPLALLPLFEPFIWVAPKASPFLIKARYELRHSRRIQKPLDAASDDTSAGGRRNSHHAFVLGVIFAASAASSCLVWR